MIFWLDDVVNRARERDLGVKQEDGMCVRMDKEC